MSDMRGYNYDMVIHKRPRLVQRLIEIFCRLLNHYPRSYTGSWAWGYNYVCDRCGAFADPWSDKKMKAATKAVGDCPDQERVADVARMM